MLKEIKLEVCYILSLHRNLFYRCVFFLFGRFYVIDLQDRDVTILTSLRLHFAKTIALIINSIPSGFP